LSGLGVRDDRGERAYNPAATTQRGKNFEARKEQLVKGGRTGRPVSVPGGHLSEDAGNHETSPPEGTDKKSRSPGVQNGRRVWKNEKKG